MNENTDFIEDTFIVKDEGVKVVVTISAPKANAYKLSPHTEGAAATKRTRVITNGRGLEIEVSSCVIFNIEPTYSSTENVSRQKLLTIFRNEAVSILKDDAYKTFRVDTVLTSGINIRFFKRTSTETKKAIRLIRRLVVLALDIAASKPEDLISAANERLEEETSRISKAVRRDLQACLLTATITDPVGPQEKRNEKV